MCSLHTGEAGHGLVMLADHAARQVVLLHLPSHLRVETKYLAIVTKSLAGGGKPVREVTDDRQKYCFCKLLSVICHSMARRF